MSRSDHKCVLKAVVDDFICVCIHVYIHTHIYRSNHRKKHIESSRAHQFLIFLSFISSPLFSVVQGTIANGDEQVQKTIILFLELIVDFN